MMQHILRQHPDICCIRPSKPLEDANTEAKSVLASFEFFPLLIQQTSLAAASRLFRDALSKPLHLKSFQQPFRVRGFPDAPEALRVHDDPEVHLSTDLMRHVCFDLPHDGGHHRHP